MQVSEAEVVLKALSEIRTGLIVLSKTHTLQMLWWSFIKQYSVYDLIKDANIELSEIVGYPALQKGVSAS